MDDLALPIMDSLLACLCAELATSPGGSPCFCGLIPGGQPVADSCGCQTTGGACGMAWVRFVRSYPSTQFPNQDVNPQKGPCSKPQAAVLELGVYRCIPTLTGSGKAPDAAAQTQAVITQQGDWKALRTAAGCCDALNPFDVVLGPIENRSQGGCGGPVGQVTIRLSRATR